MTDFKIGRNSKNKLLVPVAALILCTFALAGVGYASYTSSATIDQNAVGAELITLSLKDGKDTELGSAGFSSEYAIEVNSERKNGNLSYSVNAFDEVIGSAKLVIDSTKATDITSVKLTYEVTLPSEFEDTYPYLEYYLTIDGKTLDPKNGTEDTLTSNHLTSHDIKLHLKSSAGSDSLDDEPEGFVYSVKIIATPVI